MIPDMTQLYFERQLLHARAKAPDPLKVAASICGVNAQRGVTIYLSFWNRMHDLKKDVLDCALYQTKTLVKIWCMRGTVHIIPSEQFHMYKKATTPSRLWSPSDISDNFCEKVIKVLEEPLTKSEIADRIQGKVNPTGKELRTKVGRAVRMLGYKGVIVFGSPVGTGVHIREYTFALAENWLPPFDSISEEEARQTLLSNYLRCYGPATVQDFAYWAGFKVREARKVFGLIDGEEVTIGAKKYYINAGDTFESEDESDHIVLLPEYDSYVMGHKDKSRIIKEEYRSQVFLPLAAVAATIVKNGHIIGTWHMKKDRTKDMVTFQISPFEKIKDDDLSSIHKEIKKIAQFMNMEYVCRG